MQFTPEKTQLSSPKLAAYFIKIFVYEVLHFDPQLTNKLSISSI
jgi:hypothetical protein